MDNLYNRVVRRRRRGEGGFTLIELLVVIAILGVLAGIVVFNVTGIKGQGNIAACNADAQTIQAALDEYYNDNGDSYGAFAGGGTLTSPSQLIPLDAYLNNPPALGTPTATSHPACKSFTLAPSTGTKTDLVVTGNANT